MLSDFFLWFSHLSKEFASDEDEDYLILISVDACTIFLLSSSLYSDFILLIYAVWLSDFEELGDRTLIHK